jgi:hypothetical protein
MPSILGANMHDTKLKLIALVIILWWSTLAAAENNSVKDILDKILSAQDDEVLDLIDDTGKLYLQEDDLIQLYIGLLDYYVGEAPGEILGEKVTKIGERILPFLVEKEYTPLKCSERYKKLCYRDMKERNVHIERMIKAIKDGTVLYAEFPRGLETEAEKDMRIIRIFLEDFRLHRKSLPKSLSALKDYAWQRYGYKLRILNPWGEPLRYVPKKANQYVLEPGKGAPEE